jgi:hypothetical protein
VLISASIKGAVLCWLFLSVPSGILQAPSDFA